MVEGRVMSVCKMVMFGRGAYLGVSVSVRVQIVYHRLKVQCDDLPPFLTRSVHREPSSEPATSASVHHSNHGRM